MQAISSKIGVVSAPTEDVVPGGILRNSENILILPEGGFTFLDSRVIYSLSLQERFKDVKSEEALKARLGEKDYAAELKILEKVKAHFLKKPEYEIYFKEQFGEQPWQQICGIINFLNKLPSEVLEDSALENCINENFVEVLTQLYRTNRNVTVLDSNTFKGLHFIPKTVFDFKKLESLRFCGHCFRIVPAEIGQLTKLKILFLFGNEITTISSEIKYLMALESLYLGHNKLIRLPAEIAQLKALKCLELHNNCLTQVPVELNACTQLTYLNLNENLCVKDGRKALVKLGKDLPNCTILPTI